MEIRREILQEKVESRYDRRIFQRMVLIHHQHEVFWNGADLIDQQDSYFHPAALCSPQVIEDGLTDPQLDVLESPAEIAKETDIIVVFGTEG